MTWIKSLWDSITGSGNAPGPIEDALGAMVEGVAGQVTAILPIGIGLMAVLAAPRIIKRVINAFL